MQRRSLLTALSATTTLSGGCLSAIREWDTPATQLGWFGAQNGDTQSSHRFELVVERDGEQVHYSSHKLEPAEQTEPHRTRFTQAVATCEWGSTRGDYTVRARIDGQDWVEKSVTKYAASKNADCVLAAAEYSMWESDTFILDLKHPCTGRDYYPQMCPNATQ